MADKIESVLSDAEIKSIMLAGGFSIKLGHSDLMPYVYNAARDIEAAAIEKYRASVAGAEPVAVVGDTYQLFWIGSGPISPLIGRLNIKPGDHLYAAPAPAQGVWQTIESAPKDGARILVARAGHSQTFVCSWDSNHGHWSISAGPMGGFAEPTHWAPVPVFITQEVSR